MILIPSKYKKLFWTALLVLLLVCGWMGTQLKYVYNLDDFHSKSSSEYLLYDSIQKQFQSGDNNLIILGIENNSSVLTHPFLLSLMDLEKRISHLPAVTSVSSHASLKFYVQAPLGTHSLPFFHLKDQQRTQQDSTFFLKFQDVHSKYISDNRRACCIYINLVDKASLTTVQQIIKILDSAQIEQYYFHGSDFSKMQFEKKLQLEMLLLSTMAFVVVTLLVLYFFKSWKYIIVLLFFVGSILLLTLGLMNLFDIQFTVLTVVVPSIITVIAMSDIIHVVMRFNEGKEVSIEKKLMATYSDLKLSLFLTTLTTSIGFLSITTTGIQPFVAFGFITAAGIVLAYIMTLLLLPQLILITHSNTKPKSIATPIQPKHIFFILKYKIPIVAVSFIAMGIGGYFGSQVKLNSFLYEDIAANDPMSQTLQFFETQFLGIRGLDIYIETEKGVDLWSLETLKEIEKIENYLLSSYQATDVYSLNTLVKRYNRTTLGGMPAGFILPKNDNALSKAKKSILRNAKALFLHQVAVSNTGKIAVKSKDFGSEQATIKAEELKQFIGNHIDSTLIHATVGGPDYFMDQSNDLITRNLLFSLLGAIAVILVIIGYVFKSIKIAVLALIPNLFPLLLLAALLFVLEISLNRSTAVIFTIAFGIAVDDTIHFLGRLKTQLLRNQNTDQAITTTLQSTGSAIWVTTLVLVAGFGSLYFSSFKSTALIGSLTSCTLLLAFIADVILLPALIKTFFRTLPKP